MDAGELQAAVDAARAKHGVPGVSVAFFADDVLDLAASGTANLTTSVPLTTDAIMHIGSITKVLNCTLLMQLVDEGRVELEWPLLDYFPEFRVGDAEATRTITVEMLVNHTSGIDGDLLPDAGHDGETIARTIERFADLIQVHAPGRGRSYCNPGTVLAGYLCQRIAGRSWYDLVKDRIFGPLEMNHAAVLPEDALLFRASVGHFLNKATGELKRTSHTFLPLGYAPAGSTAMMSAGDLMTFARTHLADGAGPNGVRILSEESARRMRRRSGPASGPQAFDCGLGWRLNGEFISHGGGGPGIVSFLIAHPASQTAAVVLTNAEHGFAVIADVIRPLLVERLGLDPFPPLPLPSGANVDPAPYVGRYETINTVHHVESRDGQLHWASYSTQKYYDSSPMQKPEPAPLIAAGKDRFLADSRVSTMPTTDTSLLTFVEPDATGRMQFLVENLWLFPRCESNAREVRQ
jgi:CubicO group peptidase (beta-lactamase class C family)